MSHGKVHTKASIMLAGGFLVVTYLTSDASLLQCAMGAFTSIIINPDLDVNHGNVHGSRFLRKKNPYLNIIWRSVWYPYRKGVSHGGPLSHWPIIGTTGRLIYLFVAFLVLPYFLLAPVLRLDMSSELYWWAQYIVAHYKIIAGLAYSDVIHWALDVITKEHKK